MLTLSIAETGLLGKARYVGRLAEAAYALRLLAKAQNNP